MFDSRGFVDDEASSSLEAERHSCLVVLAFIIDCSHVDHDRQIMTDRPFFSVLLLACSKFISRHEPPLRGVVESS